MKRVRSNSISSAERFAKKRRLNVEQPPVKLEEVSAPSDLDTEEWKNWVSATQTRNFALKDPILDWISQNYSPFTVKNPNYAREVFHAAKESRGSNSFVQFIMEQGRKFESYVIRLLGERFGNSSIVSLGGELNCRSPEKVQETIDAMNKGIPFIHGALLHNPKTRTFGIPDLLVRSDWLNTLATLDHPLTDDEEWIPAPKLRDTRRTDESPVYHYRVVDVKFSTLCLRSDATHLLNSGSFPAYKTQLYIYTQALALIQGYDSQKAYILGRRWKYTSKGHTYKGHTCFERLGVIDYAGIDAPYAQVCNKAVEWIRDVRGEDSADWNVTSPPLSRPELYPNMCNTYDYPWHNVKEKIASEINELTMLWMVGPQNREIAHQAGIYDWKDERCNPDLLGVRGKYTNNILTHILDINQPHSDRLLKLKPRTIEKNPCGWKNKSTVEFYIDFETINDVFDDFTEMPTCESLDMIFMIGVGYECPETGKWVYQDFTVDTLSLQEERRICFEFVDFVERTSRKHGVSDPLCVHWAHAEKTQWTEAVQRHAGLQGSGFQLFDLHKLFKDEPIVIKGCLGFGLKQVAKSMKEYGFIQTSWTTSSCLDGKSAMVGAWKAFKIAKERCIGMKDVPETREIVRYNEVDVKVLYEILLYLRVHHT